MAGTFFLGVVCTRELERLKALCGSYMRYFFIDIALLEKNLQRNEVEVCALFHQTGEFKLIKIRNFKNQNSPKKIEKNFLLKFSKISSHTFK